MMVSRNNVVEMVQNDDGVFEPATPDFYEPIGGGIKEILFVPLGSFPFAKGGIINSNPVRRDEIKALKK